MDQMTRAARKRCTRLLRELRFRQRFVLADFIEHVERRRGRPIKLVPSDLDGTGPCGLMLATADKDLVLFPESASRLHQEHIVVHEIGHLLFGHAEDSAGGADDAAIELEALRRLAPDVPLEMIRRMLARTSYEDQHEREAEVFATMLLATARRDGLQLVQHCDERTIRISSVFDPADWACAA